MKIRACRSGTVMLCALVSGCGGPAAEPANPGRAQVTGGPAMTAPVAPPASGSPASSSSAGDGGATGEGVTSGTRPIALSPLTPSQLGADLASVGLDVAKLPPLQALTREQLNKVMATFTKATGLACKGCHGDGGFAVDTPQKHLTRHMWNDMVRGLAWREPGAALYCDSCHQSKAKFLHHGVCTAAFACR
jgi:hypothetical protein